MTTRTTTALSPFDDVVAELLELDVDPLGRPLEDADAIRAGIPAWHPRNDGDDDAGDDAGDDDGDDDGDGDDDDSSDDDDDDEDADTPEAKLAAAQKATAAANRKVRELERKERDRTREADEAEGRWEKIAKEAQAKVEELEDLRETDRKEGLAIAALSKLGSKNPARHVKLLELDDVEDEATAESAAKRLKREDRDLFRNQATRQKRNAGGREEEGDDDDDEGDDGDRNGRRSKAKPVGVARIRRGYEKSSSSKS